MDTHYSFLNKCFESYVEYDNDILIEDVIVEAIILMVVFMVPLLFLWMQRLSLAREH